MFATMLKTYQIVYYNDDGHTYRKSRMFSVTLCHQMEQCGTFILGTALIYCRWVQAFLFVWKCKVCWYSTNYTNPL